MALELSKLDFPSFFDGSWIGEKYGQSIEIKNAQCSFEVSKNCPITRDKNVITLFFKAREYWLLCASLNIMSWSDGDVWIRKPEVIRRLRDMSLRHLAGSWRVADEDIGIDINVEGIVSFTNKPREKYVLRKTHQTFRLEYNQKNYPLLVTAYNRNQLCWKNLGVWLRNTPLSDENEFERPLTVEYQHLGNPYRIYHRVTLASFKKSMKMSEAKDIVIVELNDSCNRNVIQSEIHLVYNGKCLSSDISLAAAGVKSGSSLTIITTDSGPEQLTIDDYDDAKTQQILDRKWEAQEKKMTKPVRYDGATSLGSIKFKLGSAGPTEPRSVSLGDFNIDDQEFEVEDESEETDYSSEEDEIDEKEFESLKQAASTMSAANLVRRQTNTMWTETEIIRMKNEMKEHIKGLQGIENTSKGVDLLSIDLNVFTGQWVGKKAKHKISINGSKGVIDFLGTKACPFFRDNLTKEIVLEYQKKKFKIIKIPLSLGEILWSDGDVWVRRPDENALSDPKNVEISELQGRYFRGPSKDEPCEIRGNVINFRITKGCVIVKDKDGINFLYKNKKYAISQVSPDRQKIFWDDEDVWYRDQNVDVDYKSDQEFFSDGESSGKFTRKLSLKQVKSDGPTKSRWRSFSLKKFPSTRRSRIGRSRFSVFREDEET